MTKYKVKLKSSGEVYSSDFGQNKVEAGDQILIESEHGTEIGYVVRCGKSNRSGDLKKEKKPKMDDNEKNNEENGSESEKREVTFIRKLTQKDIEKVAQLNREAKTYLIECHKKIDKYKLPMELLDVDFSFDEKKLTFYFTAPSRVDFRSLVSELAHTFKKVIRLQQVGARDEARYLGGIGRCGETLCCKRFLKGNLESVTLDMAYDQNLAQMGSNRVTGVCGKLMCCLSYELKDYRKNKNILPKLGDKITTKEGKGVVVGQKILQKKIEVKLDKNDNIVEVSC